MEAARRLGLAENRQPHPPARPSGDVLVNPGCCVGASVSPKTLPCASAIRRLGIANYHYPATAAVVSTRSISGL